MRKNTTQRVSTRDAHTHHHTHARTHARVRYTPARTPHPARESIAAPARAQTRACPRPRSRRHHPSFSPPSRTDSRRRRRTARGTHRRRHLGRSRRDRRAHRGRRRRHREARCDVTRPRCAREGDGGDVIDTPSLYCVPIRCVRGMARTARHHARGSGPRVSMGRSRHTPGRASTSRCAASRRRAWVRSWRASVDVPSVLAYSSSRSRRAVVAQSSFNRRRRG